MKVAIAGYGVEGKVSYSYWRELGHEVTIVDERDFSPYDLPYGASAITGRNAFKKLRDFDLVIRTASLRPDKIKTKGKVWSATNEFFDKCPAPIIGVTGTKGKGTTSSLIASILRAAGKTVHLVGNIGIPALELLPTVKKNDIVVFEISSFQLWDIETSPHVAVVLMIEPDHLDVHKNMKEYVGAKAMIRKHQGKGDICVYNHANEYSSKIAHSSKSGTLLSYNQKGPRSAYVKEAYFYFGDKKLCPTSSLPLPGAHNIENACAAVAAVQPFGLSVRAVERGMRSFKGLEHRIEFVAEKDGVAYYNDSYSSAPGACIAALASFEAPKILLCGGYDKGVKYDSLAKGLAATQNLKHVVLMGQTRHKIAKALKSQKFAAYTICDSQDFEEIVLFARSLAEKGDVVLLSPACASFDMFANFSQRGDQFMAIVGRL